jgi:hypothetical protein
MSSQNFGSQRRQFSRRDTSRSAIASIPGFAPAACELRNVSEGGALIAFGNGYVPERPFRLTIEGMTLACEVRHSSANGIGVRFLNLSEGTALIKQLYQQPVTAPELWKPETETQTAAVSVRSLREGLRVARAGSTDVAPVETPIVHITLPAPDLISMPAPDVEPVVTIVAGDVVVDDAVAANGGTEREAAADTPDETLDEIVGEKVEAPYVFLQNYAEQLARAQSERL